MDDFLDQNDWSSLFVACKAVNIDRGLIHKLDYRAPWNTPNDKEHREAKQKLYTFRDKHKKSPLP